MATAFDRITVEPRKCGGKPCIRGMRIMVRRVLELLATYPDLRACSPSTPFEPEDLQQALRYAAATVDDERITPRVTSPTPLPYNSGYTVATKTSVSMPDELFRQAEVTARRLRVSRSELYAKAIAQFLKHEDGTAITERLNELYTRNPAKLDSALHRAQLKSLRENS